jgi:hypothetical protein
MEYHNDHGGFRGYAEDLVIAPDGQLLASLQPGGTALVWDIAAWTAPRPLSLTEKAVADSWAKVGSPDPGESYAAIGLLTRAAGPTVALLEKTLRPTVAADPKRTQQLLADLDSHTFAVRNKAFLELEKLGDSAVPALHQALAGSPSEELRQRVRLLLAKLDDDHPKRLQMLRGIQVLELIGTGPARALLQTLAKGTAETRQTQEAQAGLQRLAMRNPSAP